jgi:hypothetical protein
MGIQTPMPLQSVVIRDSEYYIPDGNTVIQVENVLFKVHRYILSRDGSAFEGMFSLDGIPRSESSESLAPTSPVHHHSPGSEGLSDSSPILLSGDTASDFRALLWALYALPAEVFAVPSSTTQLLRLISIARIAHKYAFRTTEAWALTVLTMCVCQSGTPTTPDGSATATGMDSMGLAVPMGFVGSSSPIASSTSILIQLTEVAVLCAHDELHEAVEPIWADLLFAGQTKDIVSAMTIADRYKTQLRPLLGLAYYLMMLKGKEEWSKCAVGYEGDDDNEIDHGEGKTKGGNSKPRLTRDQRIRLLTGYYNLSRACDTLPSTPPKLTHHSSCILPAQQAQSSIGLGGAGTAAAHAHARCNEAWEALWATLTISTVANLRSVGDTPIQVPIIKIQNVDLLRKLHMVNYVLESLVNGVDGNANGASGGVNANTILGGIGTVGMSYMSVAGKMNKGCLRNALKASEEKVNDVLYGLADCFVE